MSWNNNQNKQKPQFTPHEPDVFTDSKIKLYGVPVQEGAWTPSLRVKMVGNNPSIEVSTGLKDKRDRVIRIDTPMNPVTLHQLLNMIDVVANSKAAVSFELENWGHEFNWDNDQRKSIRNPERSVISRFSIEKTDEGVVRFSVAGGRNRNVVPFNFGNDEWHKWMKDGNYMTDAQLSSVAAKSWTEVIRKVYLETYIKEWTEPAWEKERRLQRLANVTGGQGGGQGGGGYQQQQQQRPNQGYQAPAPAPAPAAQNDPFGFDDDIPM